MDRMTSLTQSPLELALARELRTGERVLWKGTQLARVAARGFGLYIFAIPWTAFALFWTAMATAGVSSMETGAGWLAWAFPLFGVPFILIGLGMLALPFIPLLQRGKVLYAITSERVLRLQLGRKLDVKSVPASRLSHIERSERRDGSGSLKIAIGVRRDSDGDKHTDYFELGEVEDVLAAHDQLALIAKRATET